MVIVRGLVVTPSDHAVKVWPLEAVAVKVTEVPIVSFIVCVAALKTVFGGLTRTVLPFAGEILSVKATA
jgi:hypothetical protein